MSKKVYILSTKYIEQCFIFKSQTKSFEEISNIRTKTGIKKAISLFSFYNDLCHENRFYNNQENYDKFSIESDFIKVSDLSGSDFEKIYWLGLNSNRDTAFITYSFPFKINVAFSGAWYYWLMAYFEDVCAIQTINAANLHEYQFVFVLHDKDIGKSNWTGKFDLKSLSGGLSVDFRSHFEHCLLNTLLEKYPSSLIFQHSYMHTSKSIYSLIQTFDPHNNQDLLDSFSYAARYYSNNSN